MDYKKFLYKRNVNIEEKARTAIHEIESIESSEKIDNEYLYNLYLYVAETRNAYAERKLGSMTINGKGTKQDFYKGVGFYLMAAEDGDAYSENMLRYIVEGKNPCNFLGEAQSGNTEYMRYMAASYFHYGKHYERAIDWLAKASVGGNEVAKLDLAEFLFMSDDMIYNSNKGAYVRYYQDEEWIKLAQKYCVNHERIFKEILIVNAKDCMDNIFDILKDVLKNNIYDEDIRRRIKELYLTIINTANSYNRGIDKDN